MISLNQTRRNPMEKIINVPLDEETKAALERRADENGRATRKEAAAIIKEAVFAAYPELFEGKAVR